MPILRIYLNKLSRVKAEDLRMFLNEEGITPYTGLTLEEGEY